MSIDRYPTEDELRVIEEWTGQLVEEFVDYIISHWHFPTYAQKRGKRIINLTLHTGGWSGNEDIIYALKKAHGGMFWVMYWVKSTRGGHYWFKIPVRKIRKRRPNEKTSKRVGCGA